MPAAASARRLSHLTRPVDMDLHAWQRALRVQAGREAAFRLVNRDEQPFFGDFTVENPAKRSAWRISIRGREAGVNYCACPDFATNTLGTCKHLEFALATLERRRGAEAAFRRGWTPPFSEIFLTYRGPVELRCTVGSDCPAKLAAQIRRHTDAEGRIPDLGCLPALLKAAERCGHELRFYEDARVYVARADDDRRRQASLAKAYPGGARDRRLAKVLPGATLLPYQCAGAWFIAHTGRCLLADDMGLGKTIQAIAALRLLRTHGQAQRVLVVCPASLKQQWCDEIRRFAHEDALIVNGPREERLATWAREDAPLRVINYESLPRDLEAIRAWSPDLLLLDEAQRIKNWATLAAQAVRRLDAPYVAVLTGTPLENRIEELHALVEVVDRQRLGPLFAFRDRHAIYEKDTTKVIGYRDLDRIGATLKPILLRRTKAEVLSQLPGRSSTTIHVPLSPEQARFHLEDKTEVARLVFKWRHYRFLSEKDQLRLRIHLQRMRMVCDSTYLLDPAQDEGGKIAELRALLARELADPARKVVIFSTWLRMHELITAMLDDAGWGHVLLHGGVPSTQRGGLIQRFREDAACRVFCSTDAGGTGLNLQCAEVVVNVDLPWNPAVLEQRNGRVHRMGQRRPVRIYNLVSEHGIERSIELLLGFKRSVFAGVLDGGESEVMLGGNRLKSFLEDIERVEAGMAQDAPAAARDAAQQAEEAIAPVAVVEPAAPAAGGTASVAASAPAPSPAAPPAAPPAPDLARVFQAGAAVLGQLAGLATALADPRHRGTDPQTGAPCLILPLDGSGPLAGLQQALAAFAVPEPSPR